MTTHLRAGEALEAGEIRCVAVVDEALRPGHAANAVGVTAITLGALVPELMGGDLVDGEGRTLPGLIPQGITVLAASRETLRDLRTRAAAGGLGVIAMPALGQQTNDYEEVRRRVAEMATDEVEFLGVIVYGSRTAVRKLTGSLPLLR